MINRTLSNIVLGLIVVIWVVPFIALVATSLRSEMATKTSGFWTSFTPTILGHRFSTHDKNEVLKSNQLTGNIFKRINKEQAWFPVSGSVESIMFKGRVPDPNNPGKTVLQKKLVPVGEVMKVRGGDFIFQTNGDFIWTFPQGSELKPKKLDVFINQDPVFAPEAYVEVLIDNENVPNALISSFIVTIPATIIPITIAAFAAYAFAWMKFPGRDWIFIAVVTLVIAPTQ